jgi:hypothetical protein
MRNEQRPKKELMNYLQQSKRVFCKSPRIRYLEVKRGIVYDRIYISTLTVYRTVRDTGHDQLQNRCQVGKKCVTCVEFILYLWKLLTNFKSRPSRKANSSEGLCLRILPYYYYYNYYVTIFYIDSVQSWCVVSLMTQ